MKYFAHKMLIAVGVLVCNLQLDCISRAAAAGDDLASRVERHLLQSR